MATNNTPALYSDFFALDTEAMVLLGEFFEWLRSPGGAGLETAVASPLAHDADRYLRDFLVEIMELPAKSTAAALVSSYLGNWYPINTLEPTHKEIDRIAKALTLLHAYMADRGVVDGRTMEETGRMLGDPGFFHDRLEAFWALTPEQIVEWRKVGEYRSFKAGRSVN